MTSPARRREAVERVQEMLGVSERRACRAIEQPRSSQRYKPLEADGEKPLTEQIIALATKYGRYGYRRVTALLRNDGWPANHKRVEHIWRREGLKDLPPIHKSHPFTTPPETVEKILEVSIEHPTWGCDRLSDQLKFQGVNVSSPTIQAILIKHGMGSRYERLLKLEEKVLEQKFELTPQQVVQIEKANPAFKERHVESSRPGELLSQDTFFVGTLKGVGKVYLHTVVDTFGSYAFGFLYTSKQPEAAVAVLHNDVLPFYQSHEIPVEKILTDNGGEFCGTDSHPYELYLQLNEIEHKRTKVARPQTNGFVERFHRTILDEFFRIAFCTKFYESVEALQADLDAWLIEYNTQRPHQGYRNRGRRPMDVIQDYIHQRPEPLPASPAAASAQSGAQPESRAASDSEPSVASLDADEHRATISEAAGDSSVRREG